MWTVSSIAELPEGNGIVDGSVTILMSVGGAGDCCRWGGMTLTTGGRSTGGGVFGVLACGFGGGVFGATGAVFSATGAGVTAASVWIESADTPRVAPAFGASAPPPPQAERRRANPAAAAIPGSPLLPGGGRRTAPALWEAGKSSFSLQESCIPLSFLMTESKASTPPVVSGASWPCFITRTGL
ncbi:MAG: hypothetical protein OXU26_13985 [Acidobacteriota bacterium]|nr:hypothetical protein [Acidobacteriota bacterium]